MQADGQDAVTAKLCGAVLLLVAACRLMCHLIREVRASLARLEAYAALIRSIRGQIEAFCRPVGEILRRLDPDLLAACGLGLPGEDLAAMLVGVPLDLPQDGARVVREFAAELGRGYLETQLAVCDRALHALEAILDDARRQLPERIRLIRCACLCGVGAIILLFL